jgi:hypothetical protein
MTEPSLPDKVLAIDGGLTAAGIPHAFGGALALAYYAEPRATIDIDVNLFVPATEQERVLAALTPLGVSERGVDPQATERDGQARWWWGRNPVDVFFANIALHDEMRQRARSEPFGDDRIPILAPEHLMVCKLMFDRPKDWIDIEQMLVATQDVDVEDVRRWVAETIRPDDPRVERFEELVRGLG